MENTLENKARQHADKIWGTEELKDLSDFNIPLSTAISMMRNFTKEHLESLKGEEILMSQKAWAAVKLFEENKMFKAAEILRNNI